MNGLAAFLKTTEVMLRDQTIEHLWSYGRKFISGFNKLSKKHNLQEYVYADGIECSPYYITKDIDKNICLSFRTLFQQEMVRNGVLIPWVALSQSHDEVILERTLSALDYTLSIYGKALEFGVNEYLEGPAIKPVFRKYN